MNTISNSRTHRGAVLIAACSVGFLLALPVPAAAQGTQAWHDFARRSLTPEFSWNDAPPARTLAPTLRSMSMAKHERGAVATWTGRRGATSHTLLLSFDQVPGQGASSDSAASLQAPDFQLRLSPLTSQRLDATYVQEIGALGHFGVSALVARQQYATPGLGMTQGMYVADRFETRGETTTGQGVRIDWQLPVGERFAWHWMAQSKLDMNAFESVHGIFAEPGDFDLPARFGTQLEWRAGANLAVAFGVERVYYGDITPFTSPALPPKLLSLMADGSAPAFAWSDLTVYSAEGRVADRWRGEWSLRYSSRQQPSPTAALYRQVLEPEYTNTNLTLGYQRGLNRWGEIRLTASYAPSMAFLGPGPAFATRTYTRGAIGEFEAFWVLPF